MDLLSLLKEKQLPNIEPEFKLEEIYLKRIIQLISEDLFSNNCCVWKHSRYNVSKDEYVIISMNGKHYPLHRLLYVNYIGSLEKTTYLTRVCKTPRCLTLKHLKKCSKTKKKIPVLSTEIPTPKNNFNINFN